MRSNFFYLSLDQDGNLEHDMILFFLFNQISDELKILLALTDDVSRICV